MCVATCFLYSSTVTARDAIGAAAVGLAAAICCDCATGAQAATASDAAMAASAENLALCIDAPRTVLESMRDANTRDCYVFVIAVTKVARARGLFDRPARIGEAVAPSDDRVGMSSEVTKNVSRARRVACRGCRRGACR